MNENELILNLVEKLAFASEQVGSLREQVKPNPAPVVGGMEQALDVAERKISQLANDLNEARSFQQAGEAAIADMAKEIAHLKGELGSAQSLLTDAEAALGQEKARPVPASGIVLTDEQKAALRKVVEEVKSLVDNGTFVDDYMTVWGATSNVPLRDVRCLAEVVI